MLNLEKNDNKIEIVIHVDKLKEGWDVNNLYTIVPLRKFDSSTLSEQTLGRGLRLPYGYRTVVDILTVIVHKKFKEIIDAARGEDSILRKENLININIDDEEIQEQLKRKELVTVDSNIEKKFHEEKQRIAQITNNQEREDAEKSLETKEAIHSAIWALGEQGLNLNQITKSEVISEMYKQKIRRITNDQNLFKEQEILSCILASYHNLYFLQNMMYEIRQAITQDRFEEYKKHWMDSVKDLNATVEDALDNIMDKYNNTINDILAKFELKLGTGHTLNDIEDEWDILNDQADRYFDKINAAYEIDKLENAFNDAIKDNDGDIAAQQSLNDLME